MKKVITILLIIIMIVQPIFTGYGVVEAQTLGDLKNELSTKEQELSENKNAKALTEQQIIEVNNSIKQTEDEITQTYIDIENLTLELNELILTIEKKEEEVKNIINFLQVSNGESAYLEYIFGAKSFTDFIYRTAVSEQLTAYNEKLIDEYNELIEVNKQKQVEIEQKRVVLGNKQEELRKRKNELGEQLNNLSDTAVDIEDEIEYQKEIIAMYVDKGCKDNEDIKTCGRSALPPGTAFYRPVVSGAITSGFGYRSLGSGWHEGIDMGVPTGTTVYSIGTGLVAKIFYRNSCGGNMVVLHHNINGKMYTSVYAHLSSISVNEGETVDRNTIIGYSGGGRSTMARSNLCGLSGGTGWDRCTCGEHLHLTLATGLYGIDYNFTQMNYTYSFDPRNMINFPSGYYNYWYDRLTAY